MTPIDDLFDELAASTRREVEKREIANGEALEVIRTLEERLREALGGETLKGLPNLLPDGERPFHGLRLNNAGRHGTAEYLPRDGREVLALSRDGTIVMVARDAVHGEILPRIRQATDESLRGDMLEPIVRAVQEALDGHLLRAEKRGTAHDQTRQLAEKIANAIGFRFR